MKVIFYLILLLPIAGLSQKSSKNEKIPLNLNSSVYYITPKDSNITAPSFYLPFKSVVVIDARFDTSKIGFEINKRVFDFNFKDFRKVKLEGGVQHAIQAFYNTSYKNCFQDSSNKLLIVLKTLWIDNFPSRRFREKRRYDIVRASFQDVYTKIEYYLQTTQGYYPLKRVDTVFQLTERNIQQYNSKINNVNLTFFMSVLRSLVEDLNFKDLLSKASSRKILAFKDIDSFNRSRFLLPILNDSNISKGVFANFKEFCSNAPSSDNYEIIKKYDALLVKRKDTTRHTFWAYCDEEGVHKSTSIKTKMVRTGNTFEYFIFDNIIVPRNGAGNVLTLGNGAKELYVLRPRQVDMETGEIY